MKSIYCQALNVLISICALQTILGGWVDPDTIEIHKKMRSLTTHDVYDVVMSDEFNIDGRDFQDGSDPKWTAIDRSDDDQTAQGRKSLQFYNGSYATTRNGSLIIKTTTDDTEWKGWNPYEKKYQTMSRHFRSAMLQGWNKFCFTGGIMEVRVKFPGRSDTGGLWPAVWLLGNLGRATFESSTNLMWPWSYRECNRDLQRAQEISGCDITAHYSLNPHQGRGATEIDLIEVMAGTDTPLPIVKSNLHRPYGSMTLQLAPGIPAVKHRPFSGTLPEWGFHWYNNLSYGKNVSINPFFYGTYLSQTSDNEPIPRSILESYQCDALSSMAQLGEDHFEHFHTFRLEWQPGEAGYIHWYMDDEFKYGVEAAGLAEQQSQIPQEPSYVILNTAVSTSWGFPNPPPGCTNYDCKDPEALCGFPAGFCKMLPAEFAIDYIRVYQNKEDANHTVGCNPRGFPTTRFIKGHEYRYKGLDQERALKELVVGGGKCDIEEDCNGFAEGTTEELTQQQATTRRSGGPYGRCRRGKCECITGWIGPNCKVPAYANDEPDWDSDLWIPIQAFQSTEFMRWLVILLLLAIMIATGFVFHQTRQKKQAMQSFLAEQTRQQHRIDPNPTRSTTISNTMSNTTTSANSTSSMYGSYQDNSK